MVSFTQLRTPRGVCPFSSGSRKSVERLNQEIYAISKQEPQPQTGAIRESGHESLDQRGTRASELPAGSNRPKEKSKYRGIYYTPRFGESGRSRVA